MNLLAGVVAAYLVGAIPIGLLVARAFGVVDLRRQGSGNIGATNVLRTAGRLAALLTLVGDAGKGYLAVWVGSALGGGALAAGAAAVAAIAGNCWSPFLLFRGGKGMATGLGAFLRLVPLATLPAIVVWLAVAMTFRYASLASLMAALCVPLGALALGRYPVEFVAASAAGAAIVVYRHRDNIGRLLAGTERRLGQRRA